MHREKPAFNAGEWTYEKGKRRLSDGTMNEKESRYPMPGNRRKKTAEYRGEQNIRKRRDVDVRNANEMRTVEEANKRLINQ